MGGVAAVRRGVAGLCAAGGGGGYTAAFNPSGGLHHARADRAAGFCTVNDCALVAHWLLDRGATRIAYVDIDAHHGDGVQALFYEDPRVLTLSIHETPETLYPRVTGFAEEIGAGEAGASTRTCRWRAAAAMTSATAFEAAFLPLLHAFDPEYILLQVGADGHFMDRLAHLALTSRGWLGLVERVLALGKPVIALGGGGYHLPTVARLWTLLFGALSGQAFPDTLPLPYATDWAVPGLRDRKPPASLAAGEDVIQRQAARSVETVQRLVFPIHGL